MLPNVSIFIQLFIDFPMQMDLLSVTVSYELLQRRRLSAAASSSCVRLLLSVDLFVFILGPPSHSASLAHGA